MQSINSQFLENGLSCNNLFSESAQLTSQSIFEETLKIFRTLKNSPQDTREFIASCNKSEKDWLVYFKGTNVILNQSIEKIGFYLIDSWKEKNPEQALQLLQHLARTHLSGKHLENYFGLFKSLSSATPNTAENLKIRCELLKQFLEENELDAEKPDSFTMLHELVEQIDQDLQAISGKHTNYGSEEYLDLLQELAQVLQQIEQNKNLNQKKLSDSFLLKLNNNQELIKQILKKRLEQIAQDLKFVDKYKDKTKQKKYLTNIYLQLCSNLACDLPQHEFANIAIAYTQSCIKHKAYFLFPNCLMILSLLNEDKGDKLCMVLLDEICKLSNKDFENKFITLEQFNYNLQASFLKLKDKALDRLGIPEVLDKYVEATPQNSQPSREYQQNESEKTSIDIELILKAFLHFMKLNGLTIEDKNCRMFIAKLILAKTQNENANLTRLTPEEANIVWKSPFFEIFRKWETFPNPQEIFQGFWNTYIKTKRGNLEIGEFQLEIFRTKTPFTLEKVSKHLSDFLKVLPHDSSKIPERTKKYLKSACEYIADPLSSKEKTLKILSGLHRRKLLTQDEYKKLKTLTGWSQPKV